MLIDFSNLNISYHLLNAGIHYINVKIAKIYRNVY